MSNQRTSSGLIKPERLHLGDTVGIIAPASPSPRPDALERSAAALTNLGFKPKFATNAHKRLGFLAGTDEERAADLMSLFTDPEVKAIISLRGGYGTARLMPLLDYEVIRQNPKILAGYSDITTLHCALNVKANLVSFHAPMLDAALANPDVPAFTLQSFLKTVMEPLPAGPISAGGGPKTSVTIRGGRASGELMGGNLSVLVTTLGTPYQPSFVGKILFLEDVDEAPYRIDRMLTHLHNAGVFQQVAGVAVGVHSRCHDPKADEAKEYRQTLEDVLTDRLAWLAVPVVRELPFGHVALNATLPVGIQATLDGDAGELVITEAAVV
jgi:muramoyltetrapeptide carboxypeptidase